MSDNINTPANAEGNTPQGDKTFTQEQVNQFVAKRLAEEKGKLEAGAVQREQELARREFLLTAKEKLTEKGLSHDLLDALNTSSPEAFNKSLEILEQQLEQTQKTAFTPPPYAAGTGTTPVYGNNAAAEVRRAMGLGKKE